MEFPVASLLTVIAVFVGLSTTAFAYKLGAPESVCGSMYPGHGFAAQVTPAPFTLYVSSTCFIPGIPINVTLRSNGCDLSIAGFFIQARKPNDNTTSYGQFNPAGNPNLQTRNCFSQPNSAITHNKYEDRAQHSFTWTAPTNLTDHVNLVATVVQETDIFWVQKVTKMLMPCTSGQNFTTMPMPCRGTSPGSYSLALLMATVTFAAFLSTPL